VGAALGGGIDSDRRRQDPEVWFGYGFGSAVRSASLPRFTITMTATMVMMMA
jgi:hypothetical protein